VTRLTQTSEETLVATNQRIVLQPEPGNKLASIPRNTVLNYESHKNGIEVLNEGCQKGKFFWIKDRGATELFGLCLGLLLSHRV
jgi:hypothetical protein